MAASRRRDLIRRRRRSADEGEDDVSVATEHFDDSQTEASLPTDAEDDADADYSDLSEAVATDQAAAASTGKEKNNSSPKARRPRQGKKTNRALAKTARNETPFAVLTDTEAMLNGLKISEGAVTDEAIDFEALGGHDRPVGVAPPVRPVSAGGRRETPAERRKRESEEYRQKRENDPAFIPNRGPFFMHDQRSANPGQNGVKPFGRGRGRLATTSAAPYSPAT
jgi:hypothetical protein